MGCFKDGDGTADKQVVERVARGDPEGLRASDEVIQEQAYLVARGVRALALIGICPADPLLMLRAATRIEAFADPAVIPFVVDRGDGVADCGVAGAAWALDLYRWVIASDALPPVQRERIIGLLLGYSADAVRLYEDRMPGRFFSGPTSSAASASK
jgi:hypothetical protein